MSIFRNQYLRAAAVFLCLLWSRQIKAQESFSTDWSAYAGGENATDHVFAVACDSATNSFLGGFLAEGYIQNKAEQTFTISANGFVAKAAADGTLAWVTGFDENFSDSVNGLALNAQNALAAAGVTYPSPSSDSTYAFAASLDPGTGAVQWKTMIGTTDYVVTNGFNAVARDADGNVYAVGYTSQSNQTCNIAGYQVSGVTYGTSLKGKTDAFVVKFDSSGNIVWRCYLGGVNADSANACAVTTSGFLYVAGETRSPGWVSLSSGTPGAANAAGFLVKLTTDGAHVWSSFLNGSADDAVTALRVGASSSDLFVGGVTASSDFLSSATRLNTYAGGTDGFVLNVTDTNTAFRTAWCRFTGGAGTDRISALSLLSDGRLAAGGSTASGDAWLTQTTDGGFQGVQDGFITLLSTNGVVSWSAYVGGEGADRIDALASAAPGTLFSVGSTFSTNWIGGGFWDTWNKDDLFGDAGDFGFVVKWKPGPVMAPSITVEPADVAVQEGTSAAFSVTATGTVPLFYRWFRNGTLVTGVTSNKYAFTTALSDDGSTYRCQVSNTAGTATSRSALLTVTAKPKGTLTVTLTPAEAVALGAAWSLDGGASWLASGVSTNLTEGLYTVTFKSVEAYATPAAWTDVQITSGGSTARSARYIYMMAGRAVSGTNVTVTVRPPAGTAYWQITETLPAELTPGEYGSATWTSASRTLMANGYNSATTIVSYVVSGETGVYTLSGTAVFYPAGVTTNILGDSTVTITGGTSGGGTPPRPDILAFAPAADANFYLLTFTSLVDQAYVILTNAAPASSTGWSVCLPVTGDGDTTQREVPAAGSRLFYRVRVTE